MAERGQPAARVVLSEQERETLERWARRPKSAQAWPCAAGSCSPPPRARRTRRSPSGWDVTRTCDSARCVVDFEGQSWQMPRRALRFEGEQD